MTTQVDVVARRRRAVQLTRAIRRGSLLGRIASSVTIAVALCVVSVLLTLAMGQWPLVVSYAAFAPLVVVAGLFLPLRWFVVVLGVIAVLMTWAATEYSPGKPGLGGAVLILGIIAAMMLALSRSRSRLGVQGTLGESMLVDLRDRLRAHGVLPDLPRPWHAEMALESAYGDAFAGDFVVANRSTDGSHPRDRAGRRLGQGASRPAPDRCCSPVRFGGLLGEMSGDASSRRPTTTCCGCDWDEGFATAVHVAVDLGDRRLLHRLSPGTRRRPSSRPGRAGGGCSPAPAAAARCHASAPSTRARPARSRPRRRPACSTATASSRPATRDLHRRHRPDARAGRAAGLAGLRRRRRTASAPPRWPARPTTARS